MKVNSLLLVAAALPLLGPGSNRAAPSSIRVDLSGPGASVSPTLYGIFFEEINHAGEGGLYAEMVRNRSFEDAGTPEYWSAEGGAKIALSTQRPINERNRTSLAIETRSGAGGVSSSGFWGMAVQKGARYRFSMYLRGASNAKTPYVSARLAGQDGRTLGEHRIPDFYESWRKYEGVLKVSGTDPKARLVLTAPAGSEIQVDMVSLFPEDTWKKRKNGLRKDLMQKLADLKPAFVRFPGGCFVEGGRLSNAFRWKETIGPIEERPGHMNDKWGYWSTDGLGFHEYLQMCEDLDAAPMFVINCGMACAFNTGELVPMNELDPWVQDALDAVEYANGPVTSKWGALRAKHGHPKPFKLKYLEVGNENGWGSTLGAYEERYARFYDAVKMRYPEIEIIANTRIRNRPMDLLDDHYYNSPAWFVNNSSLYDRYDRKDPKVYVGEYAVTSGAGTGNLAAALAEAAFMCGFERNADVIKLTSYAPLFVNVNDRKWNPDLICFDSARSYGTPSYYVQQMFARNRPDRSYPAEVTAEARPFSPPSGMIGLGTWRTQSEYKDILVKQGDRELFREDFSQGAGRWKMTRGEWQVVDGAYRQSGRQENLRSYTGDAGWLNYTVTLKARKLGGAEGFLIMFRSRDDRNWYWWNIGGWNNIQHAIQKEVNGAPTLVSPYVPGRVEANRWYDVKIELDGPRIRCYLDGVLIHDITEREPIPLTATAGRMEKTGEIVLKIVNSVDQPLETDVALEGIRETALAGKALSLRSEQPQDENTFAEPLNVSPREESVATMAPRFRRVFPPNSLTILRLNPRL